MKKLRPHQKKAVSQTVKGLKSASRGQLIMPCGSGKTLCGIHVRKRLNPKKSLILVPRLSLVKQLLDEYLAESDLGHTLVVCSDEETAIDASKQYDITGVTNDPAVIRRELNSNQQVTIFCTYPSSDKLAAAYALGRTKSIDLAIFDEAHRTCGGGLFSTAVRQSEVKIKKRLFMTATPRITVEADGEETEVLSMDDEADYGKELHYLSFSDAIEQEILSDYRIAISAVSDSEVYEGIENGNVKDAAKQVALVKAIEKYKLRKLFAFHNSVANMNQFHEGLEATVEVMRSNKKARGTWWQRSLEGSQDFGLRQQQLGEFESLNGDSRAIIHNCKLFTEGVDCPSVDGIVFVEKKSSQIDIAQAVGRAIRPKKNGGIATIVIPVFVPDHCKDEQSIVNSSGFAVVFDVLRAMKSHDERITGFCKAARKSVSEDNSSDDYYELPLDISGFSIPADKLRRSIASRIVKSLGINWELIEPHLGKKYDSAIAKEFGISHTSVRDRREKLGIPAFGKRRVINWDEIKPFMGVKSDADVADQFGVSSASVAYQRSKLGIKAFRVKIDWVKVRPFLGKMSDVDVAEKFDISQDAVMRHRNKNGIKSSITRNIDWGPIDPLLGTMGDAKLGKQFGITKTPIRRRRIKKGIPSFTQAARELVSQ